MIRQVVWARLTALFGGKNKSEPYRNVGNNPSLHKKTSAVSQSVDHDRC